MIGAESSSPTSAPTISSVRFTMRLTARSSGSCVTPSTGIPFTVCRCSPETRIWKYEGIILNCTISFSQVLTTFTISCLSQSTSAIITMSISSSWISVESSLTSPRCDTFSGSGSATCPLRRGDAADHFVGGAVVPLEAPAQAARFLIPADEEDALAQLGGDLRAPQVAVEERAPGEQSAPSRLSPRSAQRSAAPPARSAGCTRG